MLKRQRYGYDNIQIIYKEYNTNVYNDKCFLRTLRNILKGKTVLIIAPGNNVNIYQKEINEYIEKNSPIVISVNFIPSFIQCDYFFMRTQYSGEKYINT